MYERALMNIPRKPKNDEKSSIFIFPHPIDERRKTWESDLYKNFISRRFPSHSEASRKGANESQTCIIDCIHLWKFFFWIQSCFSFLRMQIYISPFFLHSPWFGSRRSGTKMGNSWRRLTYVDEIFTVYEDIKKVTHLHPSNEISFLLFPSKPLTTFISLACLSVAFQLI